MKKKYLVTFEFISGEYGQMFYKVFESTEKGIEPEIEDWLRHYYGEPNDVEIDGNIYNYGDVAVKLHGYSELKSPAQLLDKLSANFSIRGTVPLRGNVIYSKGNG